MIRNRLTGAAALEEAKAPRRRVARAFTGLAWVGQSPRRFVMPTERIYFDTNPLTASRWPRVSITLRDLFSLAEMFQVALFLPDPVRVELERGWRRDLKRDHRAAREALVALRRREAEAGLSMRLPRLPAERRAVSSYRRAEKATLNAHHIGRIPATRKAARTLFRYCIDHWPPFGEQDDRGFKDWIILQSVVDHLKATPAHAVLLTKDGAFGRAPIERLVPPRVEISLRVVEQDELFEELQGRLAATKLHAWLRDQRQATTALDSRKDDLEAYLAKSLQFSSADFYPIVSVEAATRLQVLAIEDVRTPPPWDRDESRELVLVAQVRVEIEVVSREWSAPPPKPPLKVQEEGAIREPAHELAAGWLSLGWPTTNYVTQTVTRKVAVEIGASFQRGAYTNLRFLDAQPQSTGRVADALGVLVAPDTKGK